MKPSTAHTFRPLWLAGLRALALLPAAFLTSPAEAQDWVPRYDIYTGQVGSLLGSSIAARIVLDGEYTVTRVYVGAPYADKDGVIDAGAVRLYSPSPEGWQLVSTLYSSSPKAGAHFGATLSASGIGIVVGAPDYYVSNPNDGNGRIESISDGGQTPPNLSVRAFVNGGIGQHVGHSLASNGDKLAVGYTPSNDGGCVVTYRMFPTGAHLRPLPALHNFICGVSGAIMGTSLAIRNTGADDFLLVAGAPGETQAGNALAGAAHVYVPNPDTAEGGLLEVGTLAAINPQFLDVFGTSVGIDANYVYVGGTGRDNGSGRVGSVSIFKPGSTTGYDFVGEYFPAAPATIGGHCGASLSVDRFRDQFAIGCPDSDGSVSQEGNARVMRKITIFGQPYWNETRVEFGNLSHGADLLGSSLFLFKDQIFVGAPRSDGRPPGIDHGGWWEFTSSDVIFADGFE